MDRNVREFNEMLFSWSDEHYRKMPWRTKKREAKGCLDPYRVLVSELMLQQTQVERVRLKYKEFISTYPCVELLAAAPLGKVLSLWSGLGYNRRAKYLHQTAKIIAKNHKGIFPKDFEFLCTLPGIGPSTAAGIMAFAWNEPFPMIDTNLRRILMRCFFDNKKMSDRLLFDFAKAMIPKDRGRAWNYAMLDMGAMSCTAKNHSSECPFHDFHGDIVEVSQKKTTTKFEHSKRFFRGKLLRELSLCGQLSHVKVMNLLSNPYHQANIILSDLINEGLVIARKGKIALPE